MGYKSIAHGAEGRLGCWLRGYEGERNIFFGKIQLVAGPVTGQCPAGLWIWRVKFSIRRSCWPVTFNNHIEIKESFHAYLLFAMS